MFDQCHADLLAAVLATEHVDNVQTLIRRDWNTPISVDFDMFDQEAEDPIKSFYSDENLNKALYVNC
jgi:hypothetical protein